LALALAGGMFAHGHQGTEAFGKDGFVAKSVHGRKKGDESAQSKTLIWFSIN
jgi:hypothetical protein